MSKKKVLVTGLNGVVGSALKSDFEKKYELSSFSRYGCEDIPDERNHKGNLKDYDSVLQAVKGQDVVVHLAADSSMKAEWDTVLPYNIVGVQNVFEAAKVAGVKRVIFGSSQHAVGGNYLDEPYKSILSADFSKVKRPYKRIDENTPIRPSGFYGVSKAFGEAIGSIYNEYYGLPSIHLRIGYTASNDNPGKGMSLWLSHRDCTQIIMKSVDAPESLKYGVYFAMSDNYWNIFSIEKAKKELGYKPQDDSGQVLTQELNTPQLERDRTEFKVNPYSNKD